MSRLALFAAVAVLAAGPVHAQRLEVDPALFSHFGRPIPLKPGTLVASELSAVDVSSGVERSSEVFNVALRAGQAVTAQLRTDIASAQVFIRSARSLTGRALVEGPARDAPIRFVAPKDGDYVLAVHSQGPQRFGKYLLSFGDGVSAPSFDPPKPPPVQVAQAPASAPVARPAAPPKPPPLPVIPGVVNIADGQTVTRPAGKAGAELFQFIAGAGSKLSATVTGAGPIVVTLYGPSGTAIRTADGMAILRLDATLPLDGLYFLSVARSDPTKPYKLALTAAD